MTASERGAVLACPAVGGNDGRMAAVPWKARMQEHDLYLPTGPVHCRVCTILIGTGFEERRPIPLTNGRGFICWQCYASLRRQTAKRDAEPDSHKASIR